MPSDLQSPAPRSGPASRGRREGRLLLGTGATLAWATWTFGGTAPWAIVGLVVLACLTFCLLVIPMGRTERDGAGRNVALMLRSPVFWLGLAVVGYVAIQAANARFTFIAPPGGGLRIFYNPFVDWLPSGLVAPLGMDSTLQMLLLFGAGWLTALVVWVGLRRPAALRRLLWIVAANAGLFALVGLLQKATGTQRMLWLVETSAPGFPPWATVENVHHAAGLMLLGLIAALALFLQRQGWNREGSRKQWWTVPLGFACFLGILTTRSPQGIALCAAVLVLFLVVLLIELSHSHEGQPGRRRLLLATAGIACVLGILTFTQADSASATAALKPDTRSPTGPSNELREVIDSATLDLAGLQPTYGWGLGTYRYFIRETQFHYAALRQLALNPDLSLRRQIGFAHDDYLQFLAELGWVGCLPLAALAVWLAWQAVRWLGRSPAAQVFAVAALALFMVLPAYNFFFYRPPVLIAFCVTAITIIRWVDVRGERRAGYAAAAHRIPERVDVR